MTAFQKILAQAKALPEKQRLKLANELYDEPYSIFHPDVRDEWAAELKRRVKELDSGKFKSVPADEVFRHLRSKLR
jgi:putative addiction module component (TIGR02574 family)